MSRFFSQYKTYRCMLSADSCLRTKNLVGLVPSYENTYVENDKETLFLFKIANDTNKYYD